MQLQCHYTRDTSESHTVPLGGCHFRRDTSNTTTGKEDLKRWPMIHWMETYIKIKINKNTYKTQKMYKNIVHLGGDHTFTAKEYLHNQQISAFLFKILYKILSILTQSHYVKSNGYSIIGIII